MKNILLTTLIFAVSFGTAQDVGSSLTPPPYWQASFSSREEGTIYLRVDQIVSVSLHNYMLNGKIPISELTIDTTGNHSIRFYSPMTPAAVSAVQKGLNRTTKGYAPKVGKQFPQETLAHSVEYYISDPDELLRIYDSLIMATKRFKSAELVIEG